MPPQELPPADGGMRSQGGTGICFVCKRPLGSKPHWLTDPPNGAHSACLEARGDRYPYEHQVRQLRVLARRLAEAYRAVVALGRWLTEGRKVWPHRAEHTVREFKKRQRMVRERLSRLKSRIDW